MNPKAESDNQGAPGFSMPVGTRRALFRLVLMAPSLIGLRLSDSTARL
ncbi:MAG: hypothetical protein JW395_0134 [Nitrospira sp.]|nr:hypothetical protein [Nitrospira sp.]